mmetsp:Transcript_6071/g.10107  ORF Transcript_6071/g.10107 Transcript_6071/m.10107 type:complete len:547 (+) Transcript_6071:90-1730(+)
MSYKHFEQMQRGNSGSQQYLSNDIIAAMSNSLSLAANVTGFEVMELWVADADHIYYCPYVYASEDLLRRFPGVICGHHPKQVEHFLSPQLCKDAAESAQRYHWFVFDGQRGSEKARRGPYLDLQMPVKTEMAYHVKGTDDIDVYLIGLSSSIIPFKNTTIKFLQGIGSAVYIATFCAGDEDEDGEKSEEEKETSGNTELDHKEFIPAILGTPFTSALNLASASAGPGEETYDKAREAFRLSADDADAPPPCIEDEDGSSAVATTATAETGAAMTLPETVFTGMIPAGTLKSSDRRDPVTPHAVGNSLLNKEIICPERWESIPAVLTTAPIDEETAAAATVEEGKQDEELGGQQQQQQQVTAVGDGRNRANTWQPAYPFSYPVIDIPTKVSCCDTLSFESFSDITHMCNGSNANVFTARFNGDKVIIKMIKEDVMHDPVAQHEFDLEYGMLARMSHTNVIKTYGGGYVPRRFMVLEYLEGGSLNSILSQHQVKPGLASMLFHKPSFTYLQLLQRAQEMAEALDYLHFRCHPGASIIHRGRCSDHYYY